MNHLLLNTISDEAVLHAIGRGNVGDLFTVRSDGDQDSHKLWVAGLIHDAKKKGITLKREEKYETKIREPREGAVGLWHTRSEWYTELRKHAERKPPTWEPSDDRAN